MKIPAPAHIELVVVRVDGGKRFASGAVPRPQLTDPTKLPKGVLAIVDYSRVKKQPNVLVARVLLVNLNKRATRKIASAADFNIATGLKWVPLRYTRPIGVGTEDCSGDSSRVGCTGTDPKQASDYGWQTTSLDNYIAFFPVQQTGIQLSLDLGYPSSRAAEDQMSAGGSFSTSYFQCGIGVGAKFYLDRATCQKSSPHVDPAIFKYIGAIDAFTVPASTGTPAPTSPSANSQTPCNNQNNYDPKFTDYTQLHEYCSKAVTGLTIHASVTMKAAGWFGPVVNQPACAKVDSHTATCTNITQLPKLTAFIVYASHPGGWHKGATATATFTFADKTKQTETFYPVD